MISYHPATDAYHAALRILQLVNFRPAMAFERDIIRILDFYYLFPELLTEVRVPRNYFAKRRNLSLDSNRYHFSGSARNVFMRMFPMQNSAIRLLLAVGLLAHDNECLRRGEGDLSPELEQLVKARSQQQSGLLLFLVEDLASFGLYGKDGLKDRTNLMDYRYDSI